MKYISISLFILVIYTPLLQAKDTINLVTTNWSPYHSDARDDLGFLTSIVVEAFKASNYESKIEFRDWDTAINLVKKGEKDILMGAYFSEERTKYFHFPLPVYSVYTGLIKKRELPVKFYSSFEELNSYKIGKLTNAVLGKNFDAFPFKQLKEYETVNKGYQALKNGEVDFYVENLIAFKQIAIESNGNPDDYEMVIPPIEKNDVYILISKNIKNSIELRDAFNSGLSAIQLNGVYDKIISKFNNSLK